MTRALVIRRRWDLKRVPRAFRETLSSGSRATRACRVFRWKDQSGSNNDATSDAPTRPILVANGLHGIAVVGFDGNAYLSLPSGFSDFTKGLSAFVVVKAGTAPHPSNLAARVFDLAPSFGTLTDSILYVRYWPNGQDLLMYQVYAGGSPGPNVGAANAFTDGAWQELAVIAPGGDAGTSVNASLYKGGMPVATSSVLVPNLATRQSNFIGKSNLSADPLFVGEIAALILFKRALQPSERLAMDDYLKRKWAF